MKLMSGKEINKLLKAHKELLASSKDYRKAFGSEKTPTLNNKDCNNPNEAHLDSASNYKQLFEKYKTR